MGWFTQDHPSSDDSEFQDDYYDKSMERPSAPIDTIPTDDPPVHCGKRVCMELNPCGSQTWFPHRDPVNHKLHDIPTSFCPNTTISKLSKLILVAFLIATITYGALVHPHIEMYLAYMTNWSLVCALLYGLVQLYNVCFGCFGGLHNDSVVTFRLKLTWALFIVATNLTSVVAILFWALVYPGDTITYLYVAGHGVPIFLLVVDGLIIGRIPFCIRHWMGLALPIQLLYVVWSVLHGLLELGNPNLDDHSGPSQDNDDLIYQVLDWKNEWESSLIYVCVCLFGIGPLCFLMLWCGSLVQRRYVDERPKVDDVVEGSMFNVNDWE